MLWWVGDDINLSSKYLLELIGEFVQRAERHGVVADYAQVNIAIGRLLASGKRAK